MNGSEWFGIPFILLVQELGNWLSNPMLFFSFLGSEIFYLLLIPAIYWCLDSGAGIRMGMLLIISGAINTGLKVIFHLPRPYWVDTRVHAFSNENSFGMPSGHAQLAASVWGYLFVVVRKGWARVLIAFIIFLIGFSRMYLGVHFLGDVLVGWLIGLLVLVGFVWVEKRWLGWLKSQTLGTHFLLSTLAALGMFLIVWVPTWLLNSWSVPEEWAVNAKLAFPDQPLTPLSLDTMVTTCGTWLGLTWGFAWINSRGGFAAEGPVGQRITRYLLGLAGMLILWAGLGTIFPHSMDISGYIFRFLRYTIIGLWISAAAPWLFMRLKLIQLTQ